MNLHAKLLERQAAGRPVTVGLIGAGKFGTMFLAQARLTQGMHVVGVADLDVTRARSQLNTAGWPAEAYRHLAGRCAQARHDFRHRQRRGLDRGSAHRGYCGSDRRAGRRHRSRAQGHRQRQAHRHGECGSRRSGGAVAGAPRQGGRRGLQRGLGRSAGADLRACRLGARRATEPTGAPTGFRSDVVATAQRALKAGEMLDGEGGFCVWGKQTPADVSLEHELLPLGLAHNVKLKRDIPEGGALQWVDVAYDPNDTAVKVRREMEAAFSRRNAGADAVT